MSEIKVVFAPGCFDDFEGTQEELDNLMNEIQRLAESGELFEKSNPINVDDLSDEDAEKISKAFDRLDQEGSSRKLN